MSIRIKIIFVVLPLIITSLVLAEGITWFSVTRGINKTAENTLDFKLYELENYAQNQWSLLVENGYAGQENMVQAAETAVGSYAASLAISPTEFIFALNESGVVVMNTKEFSASPDEINNLLVMARGNSGEMINAALGGRELVLKTARFVPFRWQMFVSDERGAFFNAADRITELAIATLAAASCAAIILLIIFSRYLTQPLNRIVRTMKDITSSGDLSVKRAEVVFDDEIGALSRTFNFMLDELEKSSNLTKKYAFEATVAQKKEMRIREIFQKYVPQNVIEQFFASPETMLCGDNRELAILFSDIRGFTSISEKMQPDEIVSCLNRYFSGQVDAVIRRGGIVDKYIGDALMAFWGAPVHTSNDALSAVSAALDMLDELIVFNREQERLGLPQFRIGIGVNLGMATVGNIGNDRKMNYTIIGDAVNLASRVEDLTKTYKEQLLITEYVYEKVKDEVNARLVDSTAVRGREDEVKIYTVSRK
ncbi:MAG: HAMP domain-containing protein [Spirochaetaceae bacterium]|jgi:class 3 adenylate cyclase/HAMP domain-containing protein|nr:HAMP domain-containing protein [Spirochaetaceae bacterium]